MTASLLAAAAGFGGCATESSTGAGASAGDTAQRTPGSTTGTPSGSDSNVQGASTSGATTTPGGT